MIPQGGVLDKIPTKVQKNLMSQIKQNAIHFVKRRPINGKYSIEDWAKFFKEKRVGHDGSEASKANELCLEPLEPALPSQGIAGCIDAVKVLGSPLGDALEDPWRFVRPEDQWLESMKPGRVMTDEKSWKKNAQVLYEKNIVVAVGDHEIPRSKDGDVFSRGLFSVDKKARHLQVC